MCTYLSSTLSIIIPTRNRSDMLRDTLYSLLKGCAGQEQFIECLVIDNGSTDATRAVAEAFAKSAPFPVIYIFAACPGLHVGRNLGAVRAQGEILAYLDDDVYVQPGWAKALLARFASDPAITIVGGPCRPYWEDECLPPWVDNFRIPVGKGWMMGIFSLIDLGEDPHPVSGVYVFGCNFAIRKHFVLESGGFHPDGMPPALLKFRGDGETDMGQKVDRDSYMTAYYDPGVAVLHRVSVSRLSSNYVSGIAKRNGIGQGYAAFRALEQFDCERIFVACLKMLREYLRCVKGHCFTRLRQILSGKKSQGPDLHYYNNISVFWQSWHFMRICLSPMLREWVRQTSYLPGSPCPYGEYTNE